jgi:GT2 family glycosyltransferase/2-polyprenyl-3-methyl-5-hydroxy-6-metoxy-1,4-benzoquinol methylase
MIGVDNKTSSYYGFERPEVLQLVPEDATRILDVGCGTGRLGENIKKRQNAVVYGVEPQHETAELASTKLDHVWNCTIEEALHEIADDTLDCIITADVLEHLVDPWSVLKQLQKKLKHGGKIVASIPNVQHWSIAKQLLEGSWRYETLGLLDSAHIRFFTRRSIYELFCNAGLKITDTAYTTNGAGASKKILSALEKAGLKTGSLARDSHVYQYLIVAERPTPTRDTKKVSIIILNWNGLTDTLECLESVKKIDYPNYDIIVVDNGSTDGSPQKIRVQFPGITVIETGKNLGFAEGNNVAISHALANGAEYVFLLNNDTVVDPQILNAFVKTAQLYPEAGILGSKNYHYFDPAKVWAVGVKWVDELMDFMLLGDPFMYGSSSLPTEAGAERDEQFVEIIEVDGVVGCGLFVTAEVLRRVGLMDARYFLYWEEIDLCTRAIRAGFKCVYVPTAMLWHKVAASSGGKSPIKSYFLSRNRLYWAKKNLPYSRRLSLYKLVFKQFSPRFAIKGKGEYPFLKKLYWAALQYRREFLKRYDNPSYRATLWGIRDYFLNRLGDCPEEVRALKRTLP